MEGAMQAMPGYALNGNVGRLVGGPVNTAQSDSSFASALERAARVLERLQMLADGASVMRDTLEGNPVGKQLGRTDEPVPASPVSRAHVLASKLEDATSSLEDSFNRIARAIG